MSAPVIAIFNVDEITGEAGWRYFDTSVSGARMQLLRWWLYADALSHRSLGSGRAVVRFSGVKVRTMNRSRADWELAASIDY